METKNESNAYQVHQGRILCKWCAEHGIKLETFAQRLGMEIKDVSLLETSPVIPGYLLEKILTLFSIPAENIAKKVEPVTSTVATANHTTFHHNGIVNGVNQISGAGWTNTTFYTSPTIYPIEKVCELYERMLKENNKVHLLEKRIADLEQKVSFLLKE